MTHDKLQARHLRVLEDIKKKRKPGKDYSEAQKLYHAYLTTGSSGRASCDYAADIHDDVVRSEILEALLLANADPEIIEGIFDIHRDVTEIYRELFFDTSKFRSKLDAVSYIENYPEEFGKGLKLRAHSLGPEFIYFKYGNITPRTEEQRNLVKKMFLMSSYRAMEANFNPMTSKVTKAAVEWGKVMLKSYEAIVKLMSEKDDSGELHKYLLERTLELPEDAERPESSEDII